MLLWFAGLAFVLVAVVFDSPALDYRLVMVGAVLPTIEGVVAGPFVLHTLVGSAGLLAAVAVIWRGRRLAQRRWVGLPIGTFVHLLLDGTWTDTDRFWWPVTGAGFSGSSPELGGPWPLVVVMEAVGVLALMGGARRFGLATPAGWARFRATGQLVRTL